jgi:hypothetical protein
VAGVIIMAAAAVLFSGALSDPAPAPRTAAIPDKAIEAPAEQPTVATSANHGPSIHFPEPSHDFGTVSQGDRVSHTFVVLNRGDEPLKLLRAKGS